MKKTKNAEGICKAKGLPVEQGALTHVLALGVMLGKVDALLALMGTCSGQAELENLIYGIFDDVCE